MIGLDGMPVLGMLPPSDMLSWSESDDRGSSIIGSTEPVREYSWSARHLGSACTCMWLWEAEANGDEAKVMEGRDDGAPDDQTAAKSAGICWWGGVLVTSLLKSPSVSKDADASERFCVK